MIEDDLAWLYAQPLDHSLDALESDIWAGVAARDRVRKMVRRRSSCQAVAMVMSTLASVAIGIHVTRPAEASTNPAVLAFGLEFAPSNLLLSHTR